MESSGEWGARVAQLARQWRCSPATAAAATWDTVVPDRLSGPERALHERAGPMAATLFAWRNDYLGTRNVSHNKRLRQLFRAIHCDAADEYRHVLMQFIAVHARLFSPAAGRSLAGEMLDAYSRAAQTLGIYHFRRAWIEESNRLLHPEKYRLEAERLGIDLPGATSEGLYDHLAARQTEWTDPQPDDDRLPHVGDLAPRFDPRMRLFHRLRDELLVALRCEFDDHDLPAIHLNPRLPGFNLHIRSGAITTEAHQLSVRIHCRTESDCYRALGIIHQVGLLIGPGRAHGFRDFIARPNPNGYQALQTICYWRPEASGSTEGRRLIKFNILTDEMHEQNEWGILAINDGPFYQPATLDTNSDEPGHPLGKYFQAQDELIAYLRSYPLGSQPRGGPKPPIYCFTPLGKLILLEQGSKPLDFVYQIHSEMAGQTARISVNSLTTGLDAPLRNGDLVEATADPLAATLDFSWISLATGRGARAYIRKLVRRRAGLIHPGRALLENELIRLLDIYRQDYSSDRKAAPYEPRTPPTAEIDRFLERVALRLRLPGPMALYERLEAEHQAGLRQAEQQRQEAERQNAARRAAQQQLDAERWAAQRQQAKQRAEKKAAHGQAQPATRPRKKDKRRPSTAASLSPTAKALAHELVSQLVLPDLKQMLSDRKRLHELGRIDLCPNCRPTPADSLRFATHHGRDYDTQTVHTDYCTSVPADAAAIDTRQIRGSLPDRWPRFRFDIQTADSPRILAKVLDKVYDMPLAYLFSVEAWVKREGRANIVLDVGLMQPQLGRELEQLIRSTGEGTTVSHHSTPGPTPAGLGAGERLARDLSHQMDNPYTETEVTDARFVGRDDTLPAIHAWLESPTAPLLIVHGLPRIGKSSLVKMLLESGQLDDHSTPITPVYVDFRTPEINTPHTIATHIAQEICLALREPMPPLGPRDDPFVWLNGLLGRVSNRPDSPGRLLLIIDEFDADLADAVQSQIRPQALSNLRGIMTSRRDILWLFVVQEVYLADPTFQHVLADMPFAVPRVPVRNLSGAHARLLIENPILQRNYKFAPPEPDQDDIPARIIFWTGGNPYFIHIICHQLLGRAIRYHSDITPQELGLVLSQVLGRPETFSHFTEHLTPPAPAHAARRAIVTTVAASVKPGRRVLSSALIQSLVNERRLFSRKEMEYHVEFLEQMGILDTYQVDGTHSVSFPIPLLHRLIKNKWPMEESQ